MGTGDGRSTAGLRWTRRRLDYAGRCGRRSRRSWRLIRCRRRCRPRRAGLSRWRSRRRLGRRLRHARRGCGSGRRRRPASGHRTNRGRQGYRRCRLRSRQIRVAPRIVGMLRRVQHHDAGIHGHRVDHLHRRTGRPRIRRRAWCNYWRRIRRGIGDHRRRHRRRRGRGNVVGVLEGGPRDHRLYAGGAHAQHRPRGFQSRCRECRRWQRQREYRYAERLLRAIFESRRIDRARILLKARVRRVGVEELYRGGRWLPVFTRRQRTPSRQFRVVKPVHITRLENRRTGRHPTPSRGRRCASTGRDGRGPSPRLRR